MTEDAQFTVSCGTWFTMYAEYSRLVSDDPPCTALSAPSHDTTPLAQVIAELEWPWREGDDAEVWNSPVT